MNKSECHRLDEYLLGWLSEEQAAAFEGHLAACPECRKQRELQGRIDQALQSARKGPQPVPPLLVHRIERRLRAARIRRAAGMACALAALALLMLLPGRLPLPSAAPALQPETDPVAQAEPPPAGWHWLAAWHWPAGWHWRLASAADKRVQDARATPARVALVDPSSAILMTMPSKNPQITIAWVYPTVKPAGEGGAKTNQN